MRTENVGARMHRHRRVEVKVTAKPDRLRLLGRRDSRFFGTQMYSGTGIHSDLTRKRVNCHRVPFL